MCTSCTTERDVFRKIKNNFVQLVLFYQSRIDPKLLKKSFCKAIIIIIIIKNTFGRHFSLKKYDEDSKDNIKKMTSTKITVKALVDFYIIRNI